ncbi:hypothetical protein ACQ4LE_006802 [Meloidogyne hapla]
MGSVENLGDKSNHGNQLSRKRKKLSSDDSSLTDNIVSDKQGTSGDTSDELGSSGNSSVKLGSSGNSSVKLGSSGNTSDQFRGEKNMDGGDKQNSSGDTSGSSNTSGGQVSVNQTILVYGANDSNGRVRLSDNNKLRFTTLKRAFPGAYGLKYKNEDNIFNFVDFDDDSKSFLEPIIGWKKCIFNVIYKDTSRPSTPYVTPYVEVRGKLPKEEAFRKYCYFIYQQGIKSCVRLSKKK